MIAQPASDSGGCISKPPQKLINEWNRILKESGFEDIEYPGGGIRILHKDTTAWGDREMILAFFLKLDQFLAETKIPPKDRIILELYSSGAQLKDIGPRAKVSQSTAQRVITKYTNIIRSYN